MFKRLMTVGLLTLLASSVALAHCQVPCGVYTDDMRIKMILEDVQTIEKAMRSIEELSAAEKPNFNQLVRWINTKEDHAGKIQTIVTEYFMTQRLKLPKEGETEAYVQKLRLLHEMLVFAMKCKQTTDTAHCEKLRALARDFSKAYFSAEDFEHLHLDHGDD